MAKRRQARTLEVAGIPMRYQRCSVNDYVTDFASANKSLLMAKMYTSQFIEQFPRPGATPGIMYVGSIGVGKTHLAAAMLRTLITERRATGLFVDYRELLKKLQHSYSQRGDGSEAEILIPVLNAEVLVLDELGAVKPTEWVMDTIGYVLNSRYNSCKTTIITTNYANLPATTSQPGMTSPNNLRSIPREETLGDRIGERIRSRLLEMCVSLEMHGLDYRQTAAQASLA
jgi:DNA replication protein DnaC